MGTIIFWMNIDVWCKHRSVIKVASFESLIWNVHFPQVTTFLTNQILSKSGLGTGKQFYTLRQYLLMNGLNKNYFVHWSNSRFFFRIERRNLTGCYFLVWFGFYLVWFGFVLLNFIHFVSFIVFFFFIFVLFYLFSKSYHLQLFHNNEDEAFILLDYHSCGL